MNAIKLQTMYEQNEETDIFKKYIDQEPPYLMRPICVLQ